MAEREIVITGLRWQLFAAAYEVAVNEGRAVKVDRSLASFSFQVLPTFFGSHRYFEVWVSQLEPLRCVVHVGCVAKGRLGAGGPLSDREERRAVERFLARFEQRRTAERRGYAPAGWYPEPESRGRRYWDGIDWTPWRWVNDGVVLDAPGGFAFAVDATSVGVVDASGRVPRLEQMTSPHLPPPLATPKQVVGERRWRRRRMRDLVTLLGLSTAFAILLYLYVDGF